MLSIVKVWVISSSVTYPVCGTYLRIKRDQIKDWWQNRMTNGKLLNLTSMVSFQWYCKHRDFIVLMVITRVFHFHNIKNTLYLKSYVIISCQGEPRPICKKHLCTKPKYLYFTPYYSFMKMLSCDQTIKEKFLNYYHASNIHIIASILALCWLFK